MKLCERSQTMYCDKCINEEIREQGYRERAEKIIAAELGKARHSLGKASTAKTRDIQLIDKLTATIDKWQRVEVWQVIEDLKRKDKLD